VFPGGHGDYIGEFATLKPDQSNNTIALPVIEKFLSGQ